MNTCARVNTRVSHSKNRKTLECVPIPPLHQGGVPDHSGFELTIRTLARGPLRMPEAPETWAGFSVVGLWHLPSHHLPCSPRGLGVHLGNWLCKKSTDPDPQHLEGVGLVFLRGKYLANRVEGLGLVFFYWLCLYWWTMPLHLVLLAICQLHVQLT